LKGKKLPGRKPKKVGRPKKRGKNYETIEYQKMIGGLYCLIENQVIYKGGWLSYGDLSPRRIFNPSKNFLEFHPVWEKLQADKQNVNAGYSRDHFDIHRENKWLASLNEEENKPTSEIEEQFSSLTDADWDFLGDIESPALEVVKKSTGEILPLRRDGPVRVLQ